MSNHGKRVDPNELFIKTFTVRVTPTQDSEGWYIQYVKLHGRSMRFQCVESRDEASEFTGAELLKLIPRIIETCPEGFTVEAV